MKVKLLDLLFCPKCKGGFNLKNILFGNDDIKSGYLVCQECKSEYPIINYIPRFVKDDGYVKSFSKEWNTYHNIQLDSVSGTKESENVFLKRTGFTSNYLKGKIVLDVGCGVGRFMEIAAKSSDYVVGVDMSYSVDRCWDNLKYLSNIDIVQADILNLPFKNSCFDAVFSIGVLHHTSNTQESFNKVSKLVKERGELAVWVYSNDGWKMAVYNAVASVYRFFTTKMKPDILLELCYCAVPLYNVNRLPIIGKLTRILIPTSMESIAEWRILDTFDWYSPRYQSKHTFEEVESWFKECGFRDIKRLSKQYQNGDVSVYGIKTK